MDVKEDLLQWFTNVLIKNLVSLQKKSTAATRANKSATHKRTGTNSENLKLLEELLKSVIRKFKKCKVCYYCKDDIYGANLTDMQLISKYNKDFSIFIDIYGKYVWVVLLRDKKGITITNSFQKILDTSEGHKQNKTWVSDKGSDFYNRSMKSWLQGNDIEIYSTHYEGKSVSAERFTRTLKNKIYK